MVSGKALLLAVQLLATVLAQSTKKGVVHVGQDYICGDFDVLNNMNFWYDYTCGIKYKFQNHEGSCPTSVADSGIDFVPMIFGASWWSWKTLEGNNDALMFNEPNHKSQGNLTAQDAFNLWSDALSFTSGRNLVCPSPAFCGSDCITTTADEWFTDFFQLCEAEYGVSQCCNDIATHTYQCDPDAVMTELTNLNTKFNRDIWLTEFACAEITDAYVQRVFLEMLLPRLEAAPFVKKYAWFKARMNSTGMDGTEFITDSVALLESDSATLTQLGQYYNDFNGQTTVTITLADIANHDFNEEPTALYNFANVYRDEAMMVLNAYDQKHLVWWKALHHFEHSKHLIHASAAAYYLVATKPEKKSRIQTWFTKLICATAAERATIDDSSLWAEVDRIKALPETVPKKGCLKVITCS